MATAMVIGGIVMMAGTAYQKIQQGKNEAEALSMENKLDTVATIGAEADRKYELNKALGTQMANQTGQFSGSATGIFEEDMRLERKDTDRANFNLKLRKSIRSTKAKNAKKAGYIGAGLGAVKSGMSMMESMGGGASGVAVNNQAKATT